MASSSPTKSTASSLLRKLLSLFSAEWLLALLELLQFAHAYIVGRQPKGPYEILNYDATLELLDKVGKSARFKKRQRIRFLYDRVMTFQDYTWGDGAIRRYRCSPGQVVDRYREGDRNNILISLRSSKSKGDVEDFHIDYTIHDGFLSEKEWWQIEIRNLAHKVRIAVVFPKERHCRKAVLIRRSRHKVTPLDQEHLSELPDGRQMLAWETEGLRSLDIYTIQWHW